MTSSSRNRTAPLTLAALALVVSGLTPQPARATYTWITSTIGVWSESSNWSSNAVPDSNNDASVANAGYAFVTSAQSAHDLSISGNSTVQVYSSSDYFYGSLHANNVTIFSGELDLLANDSYQTVLTADDTINVHNAGSLNIQDPSSGPGYYTVNGPVINAGSVSTYAYATFTSPVTNTGSFTLHANATAAIYHTTFYQDDDTLTLNAGSTLHVDNGVVSFSGGSIQNSGPVTDGGATTGSTGAILLTGNSLLSTTVSDGGNATISSFGNLSLLSDLPVHTNLLSSSNASQLYASLTVPSTFTNHGSISLRADDSYTQTLTAGTGSGTFNNPGILNFSTTGTPSSSAIFIQAALNNTGQLNTTVATVFKGDVTNTGDVNMNVPGATLAMTGHTFNQNAGTLGNTGANSFLLSNSTFNLNGGKVYLTPQLSGINTLNLNVSDGQGLVLNAYGSLTLGTAFRANTTLNLNAGNAYNYSTLFVNDNASNFGHIFLHADDLYTATISANHGAGNFNNAGLLEFDTDGTGSYGTGIFQGTFVNTSAGTVNTDVDLTFKANASNAGSFNVGNDATLRITDARFNQDAGNLGNSGYTHFVITHGGFNYSGGSVNLTVDLHPNTNGDSYISTSVLNAGGVAFNFIGGNGSIHGNLSAGANVYSVASSSNNYANLYVDAGSQNLGTITLSAFDAYSNNLYPGNGSVGNDYSNYGTINLIAGPSSSISVGGNLHNYGTLNISGHATFTNDFSNAPNATLAVSGAGSILTINGILTPGGSIVAQGGGNIVGQGGGNLIGQDGNNIISQDGNSLIAATGGASVISNDGGTVISNDGGTVISNDGGTVISNDGGTVIARNNGLVAATFVGHNGSAAPTGVVASAANSPTSIIVNYEGESGRPRPVFFSNLTSSDPAASIIAHSGGTLELDNGIFQADNLIQIDPNATLKGHGTAIASLVTSAGTLSPAGGNLTISAPLTLSAGSITGSSPLVITGPLSITGPITLSGTPTLHPTSTISFSSPASLDLTTLASSLLLDKSAGYSLADLRALLTSGNLLSSTANTDPQNRLTIATLDTGPSLLATLAYFGDANLDGVINADDYALLDRGFAKHLTTWSDGDFNADGIIDSADYLLIDRSLYHAQGFSPLFLSQRESQFGPAYLAELLSSIPEPTSFAHYLMLICPLITRRRRQSRLHT